MRAITRKFGTLSWWLRRPGLYPEMWRTMRAKASSDAPANESREGRDWCERNATSSAEALRRLTGRADLPDFEALFERVLEEARARERNCPVRMGGGGNVSLLYHLAECTQATRVVETGVAYGWSSLALLASLQHRPASRLISTDRPYPRTESERYVGGAVPDELRSRWTLIQRADREGLPKALRQLPVLDLCHYDSDKTIAGRRWAYPRLWGALRPGGLFVSDDIDDNLMFRDFATSVGVEPFVVRTPQSGRQEKYVGVLRKPTR
jgi:predicted O-methyltransferase YrrM